MKKEFRGICNQIMNRLKTEFNGIQIIITCAFSLVACIMVIMISLISYQIFSNRMVAMKTESAEQFLNQTKHGLEDYLKSIRRVSDALYYSCIKNTNLDEETIDDEMNLIYESNKDTVVSINLYSDKGEIISGAPVALKKNSEQVISQSWFSVAVNEVENLHFSLPHVENSTGDVSDGYRWTISLSRAVDLKQGSRPGKGVLIFDLKYSTIQQMIDKVNSDDSEEYIYLCDGDGNIICHPKRLWINSGHYVEQTLSTALSSEDISTQTIDKREYIVITKTVSYTGWKLISVIPRSGYNMGQSKIPYFLVFLLAIAFLSILMINRRISRSITRPLLRIDASIHDVEQGNLNPDIYVGGPNEVVHLSRTLQRYLARIRQLMKEVVEEQEMKRQTELDALQSQINPHFLYNTLDSVIWMIEDEQNEGAVYMIKELSKLLRISINRGQTLIAVRDEIRHAKSYINIQQIRYKNQFSCEFDVEEEILDCITIKLVVQPLLENAINYGVQGMDDEGEILVRGYREGQFVYLEVIDNGCGMTEEQVKKILAEQDSLSVPSSNSVSHGNGVGLKNVNSRIKMQFGPEYGLEIESELDEGTTMRIRLPFVSDQDELKKQKER